jgi:putative protein-disulfide isomerase
MTILHFIYDPLCGWCYCAEPLVNAAIAVEGLDLQLHGGGLWPEPTRLPAEMLEYIREADGRAAAISGQPYGEAYLDGLLLDPALTLDSRPTTAAILAAEAVDPAAGPAMLQAIQHAHWEHGRHVVEPAVLRDLAAGIGLDVAAFDQALSAIDVDAHIARSRQLMRQIGAQGFPAFVLERSGQWGGVPHQQFMAKPADFSGWLRQQLVSPGSTVWSRQSEGR